MKKIFTVDYNDFDEVCNMNCNTATTAEANLKKQIEFTHNLKRNGYTHILDHAYEINTGEKLCEIDDYILDLNSYL